MDSPRAIKKVKQRDVAPSNRGNNRILPILFYHCYLLSQSRRHLDAIKKLDSFHENPRVERAKSVECRKHVIKHPD